MKKLILLLFTLFVFGAIQETQAKGVIIYHSGPNLEVVKQLPDSAQIDSAHVNLGIMYDQFGLFWCPVWNYSEAKYVLVNDAENIYWDLDEEDLAWIKENTDAELDAKPSPSMWNKIGIKPVLALLGVGIIWAYIPSKKKEEDEEA